MRIDSFGCMVENLLLESVSQVKHDIISVCFNGECEEVDFKFDTSRGQILKGKSELSAHDENLDGLCGNQELFVCL